MPVDDLGLPLRFSNALHRAGLHTLGEVCRWSPAGLLAILGEDFYAAIRALSYTSATQDAVGTPE